jgi:FkbM family methyltransferase
MTGSFDFIEIGTSDFDTLIEEASNTERGLSIEPLKFYLDKLPNKPNVTKYQAAVSDTDGFMYIYHIEESRIVEYNLPYWVRGCNSVNKPHEFTRQKIGPELYDKVVKVDRIPTVSWKTLVSEYNIKSIDYLKVDTEGHEHVILRGYIDECKKNPKLFAKKIEFEYNETSNRQELDEIISELSNYNVTYLKEDVILNLKTTLKHEKAYVLYANENYFETVQACVDSIKAFSEVPVFVYLLNSTKKIQGARTINWMSQIGKLQDDNYIQEKNNFYIDRSKPDIYKLLIQRPLIIKDALQKYANTVCYVDSDSVATDNVDFIFSYYDTEKTHPYFVKGIYDYLLVGNRGGASDKDNLHTTLEHPACELFGVDQRVRQGYRQTGYFVAGQKTLDFLDEWYWMCINPKVLSNSTWYAPYHEETIVNVLLWKYNVHEGLPYIYVNGSLSRVQQVYSELKFTGQPEYIEEWFKIPGKRDDILFFHGEKNPGIMSEMVEKIKTRDKETKKLVYIAPHLSTGGQPQYVLKQIQEFSKDFDVYVIEYNYSSAHFIVQRDQIVQMLGPKFYSLGDNKDRLMTLINEISPDIVHLHEVPEFFMLEDIAVQLFNNSSRDYFIITTTHSSTTNPSTLKFYPDKFVLVNEWSRQKFESELPHIPAEVWEYPIEKYFKDRKLAQEFLGLDPEYKHVLNVGLFTPGKNQGEIFKIARQLQNEKIKFHFVGNQAGNFEEYWKPLMEDVPSNCVVWGERNDVHNFYQACDVFYFSSKFELNPLSIKEALSYGMPCLFRRLETYLDTYDNNPLVTYIDDNLERTKHLLLK